MEEGQGIRLLSREMHLRRSMHWSLPNEGNLLDEADGLHPGTANSVEETQPFREGLGRRISPFNTFLF